MQSGQWLLCVRGCGCDMAMPIALAWAWACSCCAEACSGGSGRGSGNGSCHSCGSGRGYRCVTMAIAVEVVGRRRALAVLWLYSCLFVAVGIVTLSKCTCAQPRHRAHSDTGDGRVRLVQGNVW